MIVIVYSLLGRYTKRIEWKLLILARYSHTNNYVLLFISAFLLAMVAFFATSTWAVSGALIKRILQRPQIQRGINIGLALLLAYTAIELSGILQRFSFP